DGIVPLIAALEDPDGDARCFAVGALGQFDTKAITHLGEALSHKSALIRIGAAHALIAIDRESIAKASRVAMDAIRDPDRRVREEAGRTLESVESHHGKAGIEALQRVFKGKDVDTLIEALKDDSENVRFRAALVLGILAAKPDKAVPALVRSLADKHTEVRF